MSAATAPAKSARWWRAERAYLAASRRMVRRSRATDDLPRGDRPYELVREAYATAVRIHAILVAERPGPQSSFWRAAERYISNHDWARAGYGPR